MPGFPTLYLKGTRIMMFHYPKRPQAKGTDSPRLIFAGSGVLRIPYMFRSLGFRVLQGSHWQFRVSDDPISRIPYTFRSLEFRVYRDPIGSSVSDDPISQIRLCDQAQQGQLGSFRPRRETGAVDAPCPQYGLKRVQG